MSGESWCSRDFKPRTFKTYAPVICYPRPEAAQVNKAEYNDKRFNAILGEKVHDFVVEKRTAKIWEMKTNDLCRVTVIEASQVKIYFQNHNYFYFFNNY